MRIADILKDATPADKASARDALLKLGSWIESEIKGKTDLGQAKFPDAPVDSTNALLARLATLNADLDQQGRDKAEAEAARAEALEAAGKLAQRVIQAGLPLILSAL